MKIKQSVPLHHRYLSHQIALNENFKITKPSNENSLRGQVETAMKSTYWKILESQLNSSPPVYKQILALMQEIKDEILLQAPNSKLKQEVDEVFDLELIKQQTEYGAVDFQRYAQYVLSVLARLCAPVRDEQIKQLSHSTDLIVVLKGIMDLIDLMKLDLANFTIKLSRPQIVQYSFEYEREKFKEFLAVQEKMNIDGLENTKIWLKRNYESLELDPDEEDASSIKNKVMLAAFIELLQFDRQLQAYFPETVSLDREKIKELQIKIHVNLIVGSVILCLFATVNSLQRVPNQPKFKENIKSIVHILFTSDLGLDEKVRLENIALQLVKEIQASLKANELPPIDEPKEKTLSSQIIDLSNKENRIRCIVNRRILEFIELALNSSPQSTNSSQLQIPSGLSILQEELLAITGEFIRFVSFNRSVFNEYYQTILDGLIDKA